MTPDAIPAAGAPAPLPLDGVRVVDLSRALAGPYATALLGDLGATVVKVESVTGGDSSRAWPPFEGEHSLYFDCTNRNKESIAIDFYSDRGRTLLWDLAVSADVLVENFRPGVLATMGLDPEELRRENPSLVIASVSGFGSTGPLAQAAGLDQVAQGMSGLMSVTGPDAEHPTRVGVPVMDLSAGMFTAVGICAALAGRERQGGRGRHVATSLLEAGLALSAFQGQDHLSTGAVPVPRGNDHPVLAPYGVFRTADLPVIIAVGNQAHWRTFCGILGAPELEEDPRFATGRDRSGHRRDLAELIEQRLATRPGLEWIERFRAAGIPTGPIYTYPQAFADPQVQALDVVRRVRRADGSELPLVRGPLSIDGEATPVHRAPPALGQDTRAVLKGLGLDEAQIAGLVEAGIVTEAGRP
ncbi:CoA transferase [Citricoccus sp. SGAir0253]|uniref:CaiB/BaiF CoA transferase family protein n=1 Tax=Citricoccus sp. SGAir0253 TaxID=2567881 RepID=UPI0010CCDEB9|nr:CoA transferase [Citricoccus sp. SGAir0253]QCU78990.1 CoA transferase [Citricoccus sp. SGAir0253]